MHQLYRELELKGIKKFRPVCYLTDEWGCPDGEPVIGIPFYLADPRLAAAREDGERPRERPRDHDVHAARGGPRDQLRVPAARDREWRQRFGPYHRPYRDHYRPVPFSRRFVRHIAGWYAQKHPDEDFAETFAVWMTPRSNWRARV